MRPFSAVPMSNPVYAAPDAGLRGAHAGAGSQVVQGAHFYPQDLQPELGMRIKPEVTNPTYTAEMG